PPAVRAWSNRLPLPAAPPGPTCVAVRYDLTGRTWQLWHIFAGAKNRGPLGGIRPPHPAHGPISDDITSVPGSALFSDPCSFFRDLFEGGRTRARDPAGAARARGLPDRGRAVDRAPQDARSLLPGQRPGGRPVGDAEGVQAPVVGGHPPLEVGEVPLGRGGQGAPGDLGERGQPGKRLVV